MADGTLRLNLGCGQHPLPGYVNVDVVAGPGVDLVQDLDVVPWPWSDNTVDEIVASNVLEHIIRFDVVWSEIHRILRVGGTIHITVPYKLNFDPYHIRYFSKKSVDRLTWYMDSSCMRESRGGFVLIGRVKVRATGGFPYWHVKHYLGLELPGFLFRRPREMDFVLQKTG
jgi:SAM-dependent methyltransferase